jgi:hypothetical protein
MKPNLVNKSHILKIINNISKEPNNNDKNIIFFNFLIIMVFILGILFLIFRYLDKKKNLQNNS